MSRITVKVKKSRFGACNLTFSGPSDKRDTNTFVYCNKTHVNLRVWYMPIVKGWCAEIQDRDKNQIHTYGAGMLVGPHFYTAEQAYRYVARLAYEK
jgi:hypothetical protein